MDALKKLAPHAHWLLRIGLASVFLYHGITKFPNIAGMSEAMGLPSIVVTLLAIVETAGGVAILAGAVASENLTRLAGLAFAVIMIAAIFMVHLEHGWNSIGNMGMEFQFTLLMTSLYFLIVGNGNSPTES